MNMKTKILMNAKYIDILRNELGYDKIKVLNVDVHKDYDFHPKNIKEYIYNQIITIRYHIQADDEDIYMTIIKKGIHLNGNYDYEDIKIIKDDLEVIYSNRKINNTKKRKKKR